MNFFYLILPLFNLFLTVLGNEAPVPSFLWSSSSLPSAPALSTLTSGAFKTILQDALAKQPMVLVFLEETLSNEDFGFRGSKNIYQQLEKVVNNGNSLYLPSVVRPMKSIRQLESEGYEKVRYEGEVPAGLRNPSIIMVPFHDDIYEERTDVLRDHFQMIEQVYSQMTQMYGDVLAIYTGRASSWSGETLNRNRREVSANDTTPLLMRAGEVVGIAQGITYAKEDGQDIKVAKITSATSTNDNSSTIQLKVVFDTTDTITLNIKKESSQWQLKSVELGDKVLTTKEPLWAPAGWSWYCNKAINMSADPAGKDKDFKGYVIFEGLQLQPDVGADNKFGHPMDCVPYFSTPIWTGLSVAVLLLLILSWGLMMLMDINTNDRFDDPKGKTITISATD